jgi:S1-C subfamily serine protease
MDLLLFYITEYVPYAIILLLIAAGVFLLIKSPLLSHREDKPQIFVSIVGLTYFILFSGLIGAPLRPYFTSFAKLMDAGGHYNYFGTGSFVGPNIVMTNAHVARNCKKLAVRDNKNNTYDAKILAITEKKFDIAFLETPANRKEFALFSSNIPKVNDIAIAPNYTDEVGVFKKFKCKVTKLTEDEIWFASSTTRMGNSGSPIFNQNGYLVGLLWGVGGFVSSFTTAGNVKVILDFAAKNKVLLFSTKDQSFNLAKSPDFLNKVTVNVLCER